MSFPEGHRNHPMDFMKEVSATGDTELVSLLQLDDVLGFLERTASNSILCCIAVDNCRIRFLLIHVVMLLFFFFYHRCWLCWANSSKAIAANGIHETSPGNHSSLCNVYSQFYLCESGGSLVKWINQHKGEVRKVDLFLALLTCRMNAVNSTELIIFRQVPTIFVCNVYPKFYICHLPK